MRTGIIITWILGLLAWVVGSRTHAEEFVVAANLPTQQVDAACDTPVCLQLLHALDGAARQVDIAAYGLRNQPWLVDQLRSLSRKGVKVRVITDASDTGGFYYADTPLLRSFDPGARDDRESDALRVRQGGRSLIMHHKLVIIDRATVWMGSANLSDTCLGGFNANISMVVTADAVVHEYQNYFDSLYMYQHFHQPFRQRSVWVSDDVAVAFAPNDRPLDSLVLPTIKQAVSTLDIAVFYLTDTQVVDALLTAHRRGVRVRVLIDAGGAAYAKSLVAKLRKAGVTVAIESWPGKMHAKVMLQDNQRLVMGSMNFSRSGNLANDENLVVLQGEAGKISIPIFTAWFEQMWQVMRDSNLTGWPQPEGATSPGSCSDGIDNDHDGGVDGCDPATTT
jgi:phosphatidylserine/phosphatidylglycerophosphate/cardiolipin synthase-like enzyme